jgi:hypothetical protein
MGNQSLRVIECVFGVRRNGTGRVALRLREGPVPLRAPTLPGCYAGQRRLPIEARAGAQHWSATNRAWAIAHRSKFTRKDCG